MKIRNIIAATDFSKSASKAVDRAVMTAEVCTANLQIINVQEPQVLEVLRRYLGDKLESALDQIKSESIQELYQHLAQRYPHATGVPHVRTMKGSVVNTLLSEADGGCVDLIVMGAHGESGIAKSSIGSITGRLLRKSRNHPVLVVKRLPESNYQRIIVAIDFSPVSQYLVRMALAISPQAELLLAHSFELPYEGKLSIAGLNKDDINQVIRQEESYRRQLLIDFVQNFGLGSVPHTPIVQHGAPARVVKDLADDYGCDLTVVGKHGSSAIEEFFIGSVTKHLLTESKNDVLVITDERQTESIV